MIKVGPPQVTLASPSGVIYRDLNNHISLRYTLVLNGVGSLEIVLPEVITPPNLPKNSQIIISRQIADTATGLTGRPWIDGQKLWLTEVCNPKQQGSTYTTRIGASCANVYLKRKIIAYRLGATQARYATPAPADNILKSFVLYNLGSGANQPIVGGTVGRVLTNFSIQNNTGLGSNIQYTKSWEDLLKTCRAIALAAEAKGKALFFDIVYTDTGTLQLQTFINTRGTDRGATSPAPLTFSSADDTLQNSEWIRDESNEVNAVYVLGRGEGSTQLVTGVEDDVRIQQSPNNRCEGIITSHQSSSTNNGIVDEGGTALKAGRTRDIFRAEITPNENCQYGKDFFLGDLCTVSMFGHPGIAARIEAIEVTVAAGKETIIGTWRSLI